MKMPEVNFIKLAGGILRPVSEADSEMMEKVPNGRFVTAKIVQPRNPLFLNKFHSMISFAFDYWEPEIEPIKGIVPSKDRERFREDVTILAGFRDAVVNIKGEVRWKARSIAFANMEEEEFARVYKAVFSVLWQQVLQYVDGLTEQEAHNIINQLVSYT
jgi:hypothetical protein